MEENKNQTLSAATEGIVVKDYDGHFKVLNDGELKDLDALLSSTESPAQRSVISSVPLQQAGEVDFPKFTDLAIVPHDEHFKVPEVETKKGPVAELHFHPDDKDDIERELEKLNTVFALNSQKQYSIIKIAQKLADKHGLKLSEQDFLLCTKILLSYFRQARSVIETRAMLCEPKQQGGLGITTDIADHMMAVLKHLKDKIEETDGVIVETEGQPADKPAEVVPPKVESKPIPVPEIVKVVPSVPVQPVIEQKKIEVPVPAPQPSMPKVEPMPEPAVPKPEPKPMSAPTPAPQSMQTGGDMPKINRPQATTFKPPMIEIKRPQTNAVRSGKPMGRVDELSLMDMATWRMLDPDPRIRAGKILGKIQNLEAESLTRKSQGVQAWRSNEVYQHYLMLGQMSLEQQKDVAEVIQGLTTQGQQTLTLDEFEAVSDLNRMLRF